MRALPFTLLAALSALSACRAPAIDLDTGAPGVSDDASGSSDGGASDGSDDALVDGSDDALVDGDGDGWSADVDCDDASADVHPEAEEICGDGIDNDCDGEEIPMGALDIDGGAYVQVDNHQDLRFEGIGSWTIEAWVYIHLGGSAEDTYVLFDKRDPDGGYSEGVDYSVFLYEDDMFWATGSTTDHCTWTSPSMRTFDQWTHLAFVINADTSTTGTKQVYLDGELIDDCSYSVRGSSTPSEDLLIGYGLHSEHDMFPGILDEVRISSVDRYGGADFEPSRTLSADGDTLALWRFDAGSGDTVYDDSGNGHDGQIHGSGYAWVGDAACAQ